MPANLDGNEDCIFVSPGFVNLPSSLEPLGAEEELNLILDMVRELNEKFVLDLDDDVELQDKLLVEDSEESEQPTLYRFVVVGNSHASRLVCALEDLGHDAKLIETKGWADDPEIVNSIAMMIAEEAELDGENLVVIYFLYDNEVYLVENEGGELTNPVRMPGSSRHHINGKLAVVNRERFKEIFNLSVPLLRAGKECPKLVISPLLRYMTAPCCKAAGHLTNYGGPEYAMFLGEAVENLRSWLKDFTFGKKIRNFKVVCSNTMVGVDDEDEEVQKKKVREMWTSDPVHLSGAGYEKMACELIKKSGSDFTRPATSGGEKRAGVKVSAPAVKRARWVEADEITAPRNRGGGHGYRGRGFTRGRGWGGRPRRPYGGGRGGGSRGGRWQRSRY
jgi:hypothetical protein